MSVKQLLARVRSGVRFFWRKPHLCAVTLIVALLATTQASLSNESRPSSSSTSKKNDHVNSPPAKNNLFRDVMHFEDGWFDGVDLWLTPERYNYSDLDLFAGALSAQQVTRAALMPSPNESLVNLFAIKAAFQSFLNGDISAADKYSKMITDAPFTYHRPEPYYMCIALEAAGRTREYVVLRRTDPHMPPMRNAMEKLRFREDSEAENQIEHVYPLIAHCLEAIHRGDRARATSYSAQLSECFAAEPAYTKSGGWAAVRRINLYCALLNIARRFSDKNWFLESTDLVEKTSAIAEKKGNEEGKGLAIAELIVNTKRQKHSNKDLWDKLLQECEWVPRDANAPTLTKEKREERFEWSASEKLRRLASAYYQVGDYPRAEIFLEQALKEFDAPQEDQRNGTIITHCRGTGVAGDKALLMLQMACLRAKQGRFDQAKSFADQALSGPAPEEYGYGAKLADLALTFSENGNTQQGVDFLLKAREKNIPIYRAAGSFHTSHYLVDYWLANLLYRQGKFEEARKIINIAILGGTDAGGAKESGGATGTQRTDENDYPSSILAGDCAHALRDYAAAALRYEEAGSTENIRGLPYAAQKVLQQFWLKKAVAVADLSQNMSGVDRGRIYRELARALPDSSGPQSYSLSMKALALIPESAPEREKVLEEASRYASTMGALPEESKNIKSSVGTNSNLAAPGAVVVAHSAQPIKQEAASDSPTSRQIALLRGAAEVAEKNNPKEACSKYMTLAGLEADYGKLDEGIADCRYSFRLFSADASGYFGGMFARTFPEQRLIDTLVRKNRKSDAEALMKESVESAVSSCGPDSAQASMQRSALLDFYIKQKDTEKALGALDSLLSGDLKLYNPSTSFSFHTRLPSLRIAYDWASHNVVNDSNLSLKILNKILAAQTNQLEADNLGFIETYKGIAEAHRIAGDDAAALDNFRKAFAISRLYYGETRGNNAYLWQYAELLKKSGDIKEAAQVEALWNAGNTGLTQEQQQKRQEREKRLDTDIEFLKSECEKYKAEEPYSLQTQGLLRRLFDRARKEKNWSLAQASADDLLKICDHYSQTDNTRQVIQADLASMFLDEGNLHGAKESFNKIIDSPGYNARQWENKPCNLVKAYVDAGKIDEACSYMQFLLDGRKTQAPYLIGLVTSLSCELIGRGQMQQAKQLINALFEKGAVWMPLIDQFHIAADLADSAIDAGETQQIPALLERAEAILEGDDGKLLLPEISRLWRRIGKEKQADSIDSKYRNYLAKIGGNDDLLVCAGRSDQNEVSRVQTGKGNNFSASSSKPKYSFVFAALASNSLILEDNARICQRKGDPIAFAGTYGELKCSQPANHCDRLSFVSSSVPSAGVAIPPAQELTFSPALNPVNLLLINPYSRLAGADREYKALGDFRITTVDLGTLTVDSTGRGLMRIYLTGGDGQKTVFNLQSGGRGNARVPGGKAPNGSNLEIWYAGDSTIKLGCDSTFNGIIYAPNARVEIGPGHATFCGSIVAKDIVVKGETRIFANPEFANWKADQ